MMSDCVIVIKMPVNKKNNNIVPLRYLTARQGREAADKFLKEAAAALNSQDQRMEWIQYPPPPSTSFQLSIPSSLHYRVLYSNLLLISPLPASSQLLTSIIDDFFLGPRSSHSVIRFSNLSLSRWSILSFPSGILFDYMLCNFICRWPYIVD